MDFLCACYADRESFEVTSESDVFCGHHYGVNVGDDGGWDRAHKVTCDRAHEVICDRPPVGDLARACQILSDARATIVPSFSV
jgi:hypothetical protein